MDTATTTRDGYRIVYFGALLTGDVFRFVGDLEGTRYAAVERTQDYVGGGFSAYLADGTEHYGGAFKKVALLHRDPDCEHGIHPDLCWDGCWTL